MAEKARKSAPSASAERTAQPLQIVESKASWAEAGARLQDQLLRGKSIRLALPGSGRLHIDRVLPFLVLYRQPLAEDRGTEQLITAEAAFLVASGDRAHKKGLRELLRQTVAGLRDRCGGFVLIEVWAGQAPVISEEEPVPPPAFRLLGDGGDQAADVVLNLSQALTSLRVHGRRPRIEVVDGSEARRFRSRSALGLEAAKELGCALVGIEVSPIYRDPETAEPYPAVLRILRRQLARALRRSLFQFVRSYTTHKPADFHALGRRAMTKSVWDVDQRLAEVSDHFDFILSLNPNNTEAAWRSFKKGRFDKAPVFRYSPLHFDPPLLKRKLFAIPLERIEDPTITELFREKQLELDRQLTVLGDRGSRKVLSSSLQLYGVVSPELLRQAEEILERIPSTMRSAGGGLLGTAECAGRADAEFAAYREAYPDFTATTVVADNVIAGFTVSRGRLLISRGLRTPAARFDALLQHEVGTHLVTYYNAKAQPLRQLQMGLAGYDELQEGLAVLAEYLVGGMSAARMRTLAARVVAAKAIQDGATFVDTFRLLCRYGFAPRPAFNLVTRIFRGGGFTKDLVYLRGLLALLKYLEQDGDIDVMFAGKFAQEHVPVIKELMSRKILRAPPIKPMYLKRPEVAERLARLRAGVRVYEMVQQPK